MKKGKYAQLSKNILLFSCSGFLPKALSFLLIPLYTNCLTTAEYGEYDLMTTTVQLLLPVFTLGIQDAVLRFALDSKQDRTQVFTVALRCLAVGNVIVCLGGCAVYVSGLYTRADMLFFGALAFVTGSLHNVCNLFCRGLGRTGVITVSSVMNAAVTLGTNVLFLLAFKWGLTGYFAANALGSFFSLVTLFFGAKLWCFVGSGGKKRLFFEMVSFSFPLIFSGVAWWINNASDRYVLTKIVGIGASGLYAVAYKIPNLLSVFQNVFAQAWSISAVREFDREDTDGFIANTYALMQFLMLAICSFLILFNVPIARLLYAGEFFGAWRYVPCLLLSVVFHAMALFLGSIFTAVKDTKTLAVSTIVGAAVNTLGNVLFIRIWGAYGAAIATVLGYGVTFLMRRIVLRKHVRMRSHTGRDLSAYFLIVGQIVIAAFGESAVWWQIPLFVGVLFLYVKEWRQGLLFLQAVLRKREEKTAEKTA